MSIRVISFDVWGTLLRGSPAFRARRVALVADAFGTDPDATSRAIDAAAEDLDADTLRTGHTYGCRERLDRAADVLGVPALPDSALPAVTAGLSAAISSDPPALIEPDLPETLGRLRTAGLALAVTSNTGFLSGAQMRPVLAGLGVRVDRHVFSDEVGRAKPAPEIFDRLARTTGCPPAEILHVGDNGRADVQGALGAGMRALWFRPGHDPADGVLAEIRELVSDLPAA